MPRRPARLLLAAATALLVALPAGADLGYYGRSGVAKGVPTGAGEWTGSWAHVGRDQHWALWLREGPGGKVEAKLQYQAQGAPETFETDWSGTAEYYLAGTPVKFELKLTKTGPDRLEGSWRWTAIFPDSERTETAAVALYRVAYGRTLTLDFGDAYVRTTRRGGKESKVTIPAAWGFVKISKRHILWDEMPW